MDPTDNDDKNDDNRSVASEEGLSESPENIEPTQAVTPRPISRSTSKTEIKSESDDSDEEAPVAKNGGSMISLSGEFFDGEGGADMDDMGDDELNAGLKDALNLRGEEESKEDRENKEDEEHPPESVKEEPIDYDRERLIKVLDKLPGSTTALRRSDSGCDLTIYGDGPEPIKSAIVDDVLSAEHKKIAAAIREDCHHAPKADDAIWLLAPLQVADLAVNHAEYKAHNIDYFVQSGYPAFALRNSRFLKRNSVARSVPFLYALYDVYVDGWDGKKVNDVLKEISRVTKQKLQERKKKKEDILKNKTDTSEIDGMKTEDEESIRDPVSIPGGKDEAALNALKEQREAMKETQRFGLYSGQSAALDTDELDNILKGYTVPLKEEQNRVGSTVLPTVEESAEFPIEEQLSLKLNHAIDVLIQEGKICEAKAAGFRRLVELGYIRGSSDLYNHYVVWRDNDPALKIQEDFAKFESEMGEKFALVQSVVDQTLEQQGRMQKRINSLESTEEQYRAAIKILLSHIQVWQPSSKAWGFMSDATKETLSRIHPSVLSSTFEVPPQSTESKAFTKAMRALVESARREE